MIYLNNSATSYPKPRQVIDAVVDYINKPPSHGTRSGLESGAGDVIAQCREKLAKLFNTDNSDQIVFTSGSTESLNLVISGLSLKGAHVVSTVIDHNSVIRPLMAKKNAGEIEVDFVECDSKGYVEPSKIAAAVRKNTAAIVVNHCSNVTGSILDIKKIAGIAHDAGIAHNNDCVLLVDASQSAGVLPIDVADSGIDYMAFTGHKNLFGLQGSGGLYMKKPLSINPLKVGGTGTKSDVLTQPFEMPVYYEAGTRNQAGIAAINAGVGFLLETGVWNINRHKIEIVTRMIDELRDEPRIKIYTTIENNSLSNFTFNIDGMVPEEVNYILESSYDIHVRSGIHCAPLMLKYIGAHPWGTVRASPSLFTTAEETDKFISAVREIARTFPEVSI